MKKTSKFSALFQKVRSLFEEMKSIATDKGELAYDGELAPDTEVFLKMGEDFVPAPDGDYRYDNKIIVVAEGRVVEIKDAPAEEPQNQDNQEEVVSRAELEAVIERLNSLAARNDELEGRIAALEAIAGVPAPAPKDIPDDNSRYSRVMKFVNEMK